MGNPELILKWEQQISERLTEPKWNLTKCAPLSLVDLVGMKLVSPYLFQGYDIYTQLSETQVNVFSATNPEGGQEFIMLGPNITAEEANGLMFFAAPYKGYGFDTRDIINDWTNLYENPAHKQRKAAHANMPGWSAYEDSRERVLGVLKRNFKNENFKDQDENDTITPVLRWVETPEGNMQIVLSPMDDELKEALVKAAPDQIQNEDVLDSGMGIMFLSAYSLGQTKWKERDGYTQKSSTTQTIGPTQVLAYVFRMLAEQQAGGPIPSDQDIQESPFLKAFTEYIKTGIIPTIETSSEPTNSHKQISPNSGPKYAQVDNAPIEYPKFVDKLPLTISQYIGKNYKTMSEDEKSEEILTDEINLIDYIG